MRSLLASRTRWTIAAGIVFAFPVHKIQRNGTKYSSYDSRSNQEVSMLDHSKASRAAFALNQSYEAFDNRPKHLWDEGIVRIIKASKRSQKRLAEWVPELMCICVVDDSLKRLRKEEQAPKPDLLP
jgi:hypothetical protein